MVINNIPTRVKSNGYYHYGRYPAFIPLSKYFDANMKDIISIQPTLQAVQTKRFCEYFDNIEYWNLKIYLTLSA